MKTEEAFRLLTSWYGTGEDRKREEIGDIRLINIIIKGIGNSYHPSNEEYRIISCHLELEKERLCIKKEAAHMSYPLSLLLAILYLNIMFLPMSVIFSIAQGIVDANFPFSIIIGFIVSILAYAYLLYAGFYEKRIFSTIENIHRRIAIRRLIGLENKLHNKINLK